MQAVPGLPEIIQAPVPREGRVAVAPAALVRVAVPRVILLAPAQPLAEVRVVQD